MSVSRINGLALPVRGQRVQSGSRRRSAGVGRSAGPTLLLVPGGLGERAAGTGRQPASSVAHGGGGGPGRAPDRAVDARRADTHGVASRPAVVARQASAPVRGDAVRGDAAVLGGAVRGDAGASRSRRATGYAPVRLTRRGKVVAQLVLILAALLAVAGIAAGARAVADSAVPSGPRPSVVVQDGDTLWNIAGRHAPGIDRRAVIAEIRRLNNLHNSTVETGQLLVLPRY